MAMKVTSLNSGSNANCYYIGCDEDAILIDAGLSCRETEKRMANLGLSMKSVKAIFISHEHSDHIRGLAVLSSKHKLPVYITSSTLRKSSIFLQDEFVKPLASEIPVTIGGLTIMPFAKRHDAIDPLSFMIEANGIRVSVITDIGTACERVVHYFRQSHAAFLEANYDEEMLANGSYPYYLKQRISGGNGHLSNTQALQLFVSHKPSYMSHLFLSHLSKDNNCPIRVNDLFNAHASNTIIVVASRYQETPVYHITDGDEGERFVEKSVHEVRSQMQLF
ncbi:MAG TPA: MBL fold metallo-hydrolase [Bacteroidia bacterium]|nr:MBL fold metallo-hydrolase [Bacteroidia bacterium]